MSSPPTPYVIKAPPPLSRCCYLPVSTRSSCAALPLPHKSWYIRERDVRRRDALPAVYAHNHIIVRPPSQLLSVSVKQPDSTLTESTQLTSFWGPATLSGPSSSVKVKSYDAVIFEWCDFFGKFWKWAVRAVSFSCLSVCSRWVTWRTWRDWASRRKVANPSGVPKIIQTTI